MMKPIQYVLESGPFQIRVLLFEAVEDLNAFAKKRLAESPSDPERAALREFKATGLTLSKCVAGTPIIDIHLALEESPEEAIHVITHEVFHAVLSVSRFILSKGFSFEPVTIINTGPGRDLYAAFVRGELTKPPLTTFAEEEFFAMRLGAYTSEIFACYRDAKSVFAALKAGDEEAIRWYGENSLDAD